MISNARQRNKFSWNDPREIEIEPSKWDLSYVWEGTTYLVEDLEGLTKYLLQTDPNPDFDTVISNWVAQLTTETVENMPDDLRDELLDLGYELP